MVYQQVILPTFTETDCGMLEGFGGGTLLAHQATPSEWERGLEGFSIYSTSSNCAF